jgi:ribosomal protein L40E
MEAVKAIAAEEPLSVNEWILLQIEARNPDLAESAVVAPTQKVRPKAVAKSEASVSCDECGALNGFHQKKCKKAKK